jgi:hypothetical protein
MSEIDPLNVWLHGCMVKYIRCTGVKESGCMGAFFLNFFFLKMFQIFFEVKCFLQCSKKKLKTY